MTVDESYVAGNHKAIVVKSSYFTYLVLIVLRLFANVSHTVTNNAKQPENQVFPGQTDPTENDHLPLYFAYLVVTVLRSYFTIVINDQILDFPAVFGRLQCVIERSLPNRRNTDCLRPYTTRVRSLFCWT